MISYNYHPFNFLWLGSYWLVNPLRVFSMGFGWIWGWFNGIIWLLFICSYWGWSMSKFTIPPSSFIQFLDWVLFLNILHILARVVRVPSGNQTCPWEIFQNMQVGEGDGQFFFREIGKIKTKTDGSMDPHVVFQWCFPWQPQPTGPTGGRSATDPHVPWAPSEVKEKDSLQLRLSEATAQLSQSRSGHTLMEAAAADAKARRCRCWPNVVRKSLGNVGDLMEREWDFVGWLLLENPYL